MPAVNGKALYPSLVSVDKAYRPLLSLSYVHALVKPDGYVAVYGLDQLAEWIAPPARATILSMELCTSPYGEGANCRTANDVEIIRCLGAERIIPR